MVNVDFAKHTSERMFRAVELVRERLLRATAALNLADIPYAVIGGNAVGTWVSTVDPGAIRNTVDVDLLINRGDLPRVIEALKNAGFVWRHVAGIEIFLDGPEGRASDGVHVLFANEKVRPTYSHPAASVEQFEQFAEYRVIGLEPLVRMKLTSFRDKDRTHVRDMIGVGLVDESWLTRLPADLAARLKELIDTPDG
ncbi:MAG: hypothetical protein JSS02_30225 [Planctomycetes bacterium]|nr:hypothetical protein [Planctomycetota bacterium]